MADIAQERARHVDVTIALTRVYTQCAAALTSERIDLYSVV